MVWQKQNNFSYGKKVEEKKVTIFDKAYVKDFLKDWEETRDRHAGQLQVVKALFEENMKYVFYRSGRKGAKTTTGIDIAWRIANEAENQVVYFGYPTIAQGIEVVWEERRLQTCDRKDDYMFDKYVEKVDDSRHMIKFTNGSFIKLVGTWTEARGRGTQPDFLVFDEIQDCNPDYVEAMDSNLAAKENARCLMMGTPPKKRNHYEEWWERISSNPRGKTFKFTSYDNIKLPHLKEWLDNKKIELIRANKEDVWLREYMAEFCYSSSDRILPDAVFFEPEEVLGKASHFDYSERIPVVAISIHKNYFCVILAVLLPKKKIFVFDHVLFPQVWNRAFAEMYPLIGEKVKSLQGLCKKGLRNIVWDESKSFVDVIRGFSACRDDVKWQERGVPLLRELMIKEKIVFSREVADFGLECQNMLLEESEKDIQKNYPHVCTLSMLVNEFFSQEKLEIPHLKEFDKYEALREQGIIPPKASKNARFFRIDK